MNELNHSLSSRNCPYQFWAFISYSRKDEGQAKKLHEFIETFGVPVELVDRHTTPLGESAPARLRPCFRDKDDLPAHSSLSTSLREKLAASRYLVVVCSPNSAASEWVNQEIKDFIALHGESAQSRIYAFIIAGTPNLDAADCCFPPALRAQNPGALNATKNGEGSRIAKLKLIAAMLGVKPDDVIKRDNIRRANRMRFLLITGLVTVSAMGWLTWSAMLAKEVSRIEEGRAWLALGKAALDRGDHLSALMLAGRAVGYVGYGRLAHETKEFERDFPRLLSESMNASEHEKARQVEVAKVSQFIDSVEPAQLPLWSGSHSEPVSCVAFSPDGIRIASGSWDRTIKLWDAATGKEVRTLSGYAAMVTCIAFSPDGKFLVGGDSVGTIILWNTDSGEKIATINRNQAASRSLRVTSVAFSPDGTHIASVRIAGAIPRSTNSTINLWSASTGELVRQLYDGADKLYSVRFDNAGTRVISEEKTWELKDGAEIALPARGRVEALSMDGKRAAGRPNLSLNERMEAYSLDGKRGAERSKYYTIEIWGSANKARVTLEGHTDAVQCVIFSPDERHIASSSKDMTIKIWDSVTGKELANLLGHTAGVASIAFSPDGTRLVSGAEDNTVKIWDVAMWKELVRLQQIKNNVTSLSLSPDGSYLAASTGFGDGVGLWDAATGRQLASLHGRSNGDLLRLQYLVAFSPDGKHIAGGAISMLMIWNATTGQQMGSPSEFELSKAKQWLEADEKRLSVDVRSVVKDDQNQIYIASYPAPPLDLASRLRAGLLALPEQTLKFPAIRKPTPMLHVRQDTLALLADPTLTPEKRAELQMQLCTKSGQFRAAMKQWQSLMQGEWPGFEGARVSKGQVSETIPSNSLIRRHYLIALIDATKHPQIHGHPATCETAAQIAPVLTKEMMETPIISLAMMSLMQMLANDESPEMSTPREALLKRLAEVAPKEWLDVLVPNAEGPFQVVIREVVPGSQGDALGLRIGDAYISYNNEIITSTAQLIQLIGEAKGEAVPLEMIRDGKRMKFTVKPGRLGTLIENCPLPTASGAELSK